MKAVLEAAKEAGTALEINAFPFRLDLNDRHIREAKELGIPLIISTDTHIKEQFGFMRYGVATARRGWLAKEDVVNTLDLKKLEVFLEKSRKKV
ncbi:DNA polymerase/3'-5' exonuclease PolX [bacterium BMS3Abin08]|nr:DNA polymerase/3'-5' exonuclease PolX [bacterium BMS3Abin08]